LLAVAGSISLASGLLLLATAAHATWAAATTSPPATVKPRVNTGKPAPAAARRFEAQVRQRTLATGRNATTKTGPQMYDPATGGLFPPSTVTVSATTGLVNEQVQVSWTNFTPSSALIYQSTSTFYPVMVAECQGSNPSSPAVCYGAENGGVTSTSGAFGPMNTSYTTTGPDGTGVTDVQIYTGVENQFLACSQSSPCSLVIVPGQGGNFGVTPPDCADHT
jgi:hypothetical protein